MHLLLTSLTRPGLHLHPLNEQREIVQLGNAGPPQVSSHVAGQLTATSVVGSLQPEMHKQIKIEES